MVRVELRNIINIIDLERKKPFTIFHLIKLKKIDKQEY